VVAGHLSDVWLLVTDASKSSVEYRKLVDPNLAVCSRRLPHAWLSTKRLKDIVLGAATQGWASASNQCVLAQFSETEARFAFLERLLWTALLAS